MAKRGRPKKPLSDKVAEGEITKEEAAAKVSKTPKADHDYRPIEIVRKNKKAKTVYNKTVKWLTEVNCLQFINPDRIAGYSVLVARWIECEEKNEETLLAEHPTTGQPMQSPYVDMALKYFKQATETFKEINETVRENSISEAKSGATLDEMEELLLRGKPTRQE